MAFKPPRQFPLQFVIKSVLKAMQNGPGASKTVSFAFPYQISIQNQCKMALKPPGQFPLHFFIKSLLKTMQNDPGASKAVSSTFLY